MDDDSFSPDTILPATSMDSDFINELLLDGCWVETTEGDEFCSLLAPLSPLMASVPLANSLDNLPDFEALNGYADSIPDTDAREEGTGPSKTSRKRPLSYSQVKDLAGTRLEELASSGKSESYLVDISEPNKRIWIGPKTNLGNFPSVRERLISAVTYLSKSTGDSNMLIQIWVPIKSGNKHVLTTNDQPYFHDPNSLSLAQYRNVSKSYHLSVEENSRKYAGLPGRVFLHEVPEWTPDVRYFRQEEYPRIAYAQQLQVQASLALPVFEQGSGSCLGVVEIVTTNQKINYRPELETICKALEAFQLRSSEVTGLRSSKILNHSCAALAPQINEFLTYTCKAHSLPLAQTWAPCTHGKGIGYNSTPCMSTVDDAYYVGDQKLLGFHEECCEQHLHGDKWIVGESFATNKLCSAPDITTYSKTDYPLSHHAIVFGLCAAVAVRVRCIFTGSADFVLEFFLPVSCKSFDEQQKMIGSLLNTLHACQSLYIVTDKDLYEESSDLPETVPEDEPFEQRAQYKEDSSWIANISGAQNKGKGIAVSLDTTKEKPNEEFEITTSWDETEDESRHEPILEDLGLFQEESKEAESGGGISTSFGGSHPSGNKKSGDEKRTKAEKTVSLHILQQYFAGSLKDAAKSLGVCPTTLKRICRQHGINRWPSRKIKKVGHSLKKLQLVMDTVQGADGSIQISSFYSKFPELGSPNVSGASSSVPKLSKQQIQHIHQQEEASLNPLSFTRPNKFSVRINNSQFETGLISSKDATSKSPSSTKLLGRSKSHKLHPEQPTPEMLPPLPQNTGQVLRDNGAFRLKVTFGELKVRFSLHHNWVITDLQQEIAKRFNIDDISKLHLKYLDDDSEWVLLTCDGDLEECLDIHKATQSQTITLCLLHAPHSNLGTSFGSSGLS